MGGHFWFYFVPYQADIRRALLELRDREFKAGRYNPVMRLPEFPVSEASPSPGAKHSSIAKALAASGEAGTRCILDMNDVAANSAHFVVAPFPEDRLRALYGTTQPTREAVDPDMEFSEELERGQGTYVVLYKDGRPDEILFAGYSFD